MRYTKEIKVGGGGFANVFKAADWQTMHYVAMKELLELFPDNYRRFRRERDMLTKYKSTLYVVDILDSDIDADQPYIILEFSPYGSLEKYVTSRRDWRRVAGWLCDVARGLEIIHNNGDVHRDIKPSNLLQFKYPSGEVIKLTDFGLAIRNDNPSGPMTCSPFGTKGYIDPVALATGVLTKESDIYSLGKTMRELLTGNREPMFLTMLPGPPEFRTLIDSMTDMDVTKRPTARQIYQTVEALLAVPEMPPLQVSGKAVVAALAGLAALFVIGNSNTWDEKAGRYRNSRGQFASGWLG